MTTPQSVSATRFCRWRKQSLTTRGFTIVELIVALGILAGLGLAAFGYIVGWNSITRPAQALQTDMEQIASLMQGYLERKTGFVTITRGKKVQTSNVALASVNTLEYRNVLKDLVDEGLLPERFLSGGDGNEKIYKPDLSYQNPAGAKYLFYTDANTADTLMIHIKIDDNQNGEQILNRLALNFKRHDFITVCTKTEAQSSNNPNEEDMNIHHAYVRIARSARAMQYLRQYYTTRNQTKVTSATDEYDSEKGLEKVPDDAGKWLFGRAGAYGQVDILCYPPEPEKPSETAGSS